MIAAYLDAAIAQARERAKVLKGKMPNPLPTPELGGLQRACEESLDQTIQVLDYLNSDPQIKSPQAIRERLRIFRRALDDLSQLEATGIAALNRQNADDVLLSRLVFQVHQEIRYPLSPPAVSATSQGYFMIYPRLGLLVVPLAESDSLLHLPDLYHELAHPLIAVSDNPKVEALQHIFDAFLSSVSEHYEQERLENARITGPRDYFRQVFDLFELQWVKYWAAEIFCDLFALYTLGPAYAWAHFHLTAAREVDPYGVRVDRIISHPPDQARMEAILHGLSLIHLEQEAGPVRDRWSALLASTGSKQDSNYRKACPRFLLEQAAEHALQGTRAIGCRIADGSASGKVHAMLNGAWQEFWKNPAAYPTWEKKAVQQLRAEFSA
jgi:hypothetical protein